MLTCNLLSTCNNVWDHQGTLMHGGCTPDFLAIEMCFFTRKFRSVFIEIQNSWMCLLTLYCLCSSAFFVCLFLVGFFCVFVFWVFWLFKSRNELCLKVMFLRSARAAVLCGEGSGKGHSKTVPLYGRGRQYLLLLSNGSQKVASHCHQLVWLKKVANLFLKCSIANGDV